MSKVVVPDFETVEVPAEESWGSDKKKDIEKNSSESFEKQEQDNEHAFKEKKLTMDVVSPSGGESAKAKIEEIPMETVQVKTSEKPKMEEFKRPETLGMEEVKLPSFNLEDSSEENLEGLDIPKKSKMKAKPLFDEELLGKIAEIDELGQKLSEEPKVKEKISRRRKKEIKRQNELRERREQQRASLDKLNNQLAKEAEERRAIELEEIRKFELEKEQRFLAYKSQYIQGMKREEERITKSGDDLKMQRLQELEKKRALEEKQKARRQQQRMRMESEFEKYHIEDRGSNIIGFKQKRKK